MKARVTFYETNRTADECEDIVLDAVGKANGVDVSGVGETRTSSLGDVQNVDVHVDLIDEDPDGGEDRTVKGRVNEFLMGAADCRLVVTDS